MDMHEHQHDHGAGVSVRHSFSDFLPLIVIAAVVILLTIGTYVYTNSSGMADAMRFFMGYFFLIFGGFKVVKLRGFAEAYSTYDLVAMRSRAYALGYPFVEIGLAVLFLSGFALVFANIVTLVVMLVGALGVYLKLRKKEEIPCACLGVVFKIPMTYVTLFEDLLMAGMAAAMLAALF